MTSLIMADGQDVLTFLVQFIINLIIIMLAISVKVKGDVFVGMQSAYRA